MQLASTENSDTYTYKQIRKQVNMGCVKRPNLMPANKFSKDLNS